MDRLMNVLTVFSIGIIVLVLVSVRREHIRVEYSVSWLSAGVVLLILSLNDSLVRWLASAIGVRDTPLAVLVVVLCVFLVVFYRFSVRVSSLKDANIALAQRLAILEYQVKSSNEQQETASR
jgi:hypothetical protein